MCLIADLKGVERACYTEAQAAGADGCVDDTSADTSGSVCFCRTELCNGVAKMTSSRVLVLIITTSAIYWQ